MFGRKVNGTDFRGSGYWVAWGAADSFLHSQRGTDDQTIQFFPTRKHRPRYRLFSLQSALVLKNAQRHSSSMMEGRTPTRSLSLPLEGQVQNDDAEGRSTLARHADVVTPLLK